MGETGTHSYEHFTSAFKRVLNHLAPGIHSGEQLFDLRQGRHSAVDYALEFHIIVLPVTGLLHHSVAFCWGLKIMLQKDLVGCEYGLSLDKMISLTISLNYEAYLLDSL